MRERWNEVDRLAAAQGYGNLDAPSPDVFDDFVQIAARVCDAPIAVVDRIDGGALLEMPESLPLGMLSALGYEARPESLAERQAFTLKALARQVTDWPFLPTVRF